MIVDWSKLPVWLKEQIEVEKENLTEQRSSDQTLQIRERIKVYREVLAFGQEKEQIVSIETVAREMERRFGYNADVGY